MTFEDNTGTDASGHYAFADLSRAFYYVAAVMEGPLSGLSPAEWCTNPSALVEVGEGDMNVDFSFE